MSDADAIRVLPSDVVDKIAAGEVVTRPVGVVKELIENSLDAGATTVGVSLRHGGVKSLVVRDNGRGIREEDFPLLCERFATSKIVTYDDLRSVATFGFRGEALASVSHVARLSITSRRRGAAMAYRAEFADGRIAADLPRPRPTAGVAGTVITVDDLFYNIPLRVRALRNASEEHRAVADMVARYAIRYPEVAFSCRKMTDKPGSAAPPDVNTRSGAATRDNIAAAFGRKTADNLIPVDGELPHLHIRFSGWVSNPNFNLRRAVSIFFINGRLVDCSPLKKTTDLVYSPVLPKQTHPFVYLDVDMKPENIDVNVHPSKKEVRFLHADELARVLSNALETTLKTAETSRVFYAQTLLPNANPVPDVGQPRTEVATEPGTEQTGADRVRADKSPPAPRKTTTPAHQLVRTDARDQVGAMDRFVGRAGLRKESAGEEPSPAALVRKRPRTSRRTPHLTSVQELVKECEQEEDAGLVGIMREHTFVGVVDRRWSLMQFKTKLLLVDIPALLSEALYQTILYDFAHMPSVPVTPPAPIRTMVRAYIEAENVVIPDGETRDGHAQRLCETLMANAPMLLEYFSIGIEDDHLARLPVIVEGHDPDLRLLPEFLYRMGATTQWASEKPCLAFVARTLADFYARWMGARTGEDAPRASREHGATLRATLLPILRSGFRAPRRLGPAGAVREIASLEKLYRIFERC